MNGGLLVSAQQLAELIAEKEALVFDCRFDLLHPGLGRNSWLSAHIPGAVYAHLDDNLSGRITAVSGRHPLPFPSSFATFLARSGWTAGKKVVAYDAHGGSFAARLWWLMKYFDLGDVSLLDGGIGAWMVAGFQMESGPVRTSREALPQLTAHPEMTLNTQGVLNALHDGDIQLIDARAKDRFEGLSEPIDTVAGHIPGALNHPTDLNLVDGSYFRSETELGNLFRPVTGNKDPSQLVSMCGSGVTACQNLFAMELAGFRGALLYPGSWSEWIRDPARPIVQGAVQGSS
jgi:thiosulfate/3-mercaptopyruvate sulfurtransferase